MSDLMRELFHASSGLSGGRSFRLLSRHDTRQLQVFYQLLSPEERRFRFGAAVSDNSIAGYCAQIDWRASIVIARAGPHGLEAVATLVRIDANRVEGAIACSQLCNPPAVVPALLRLSAMAATNVFGARQILVNIDPVADGLLAMLREIGDVAIENGHASVDLSRMRVASPSEARDLARASPRRWSETGAHDSAGDRCC